MWGFFLTWSDGTLRVIWRCGWEDRALQECNPSAQSARGLRMHPLPARPKAGAGSLFGILRKHGPKRKTHRSSLDEVAVNHSVNHASKGASHLRVLPWFYWAFFPLWPRSDL